MLELKFLNFDGMGKAKQQKVLARMWYPRSKDPSFAITLLWRL